MDAESGVSIARFLEGRYVGLSVACRGAGRAASPFPSGPPTAPAPPSSETLLKPFDRPSGKSYPWFNNVVVHHLRLHRASRLLGDEDSPALARLRRRDQWDP